MGEDEEIRSAVLEAMERPIAYKLDVEHNAHPVYDLVSEAPSIFAMANRRVAETFLFRGRVHVSTVFLGIDHSFLGSGPPVLFETMTFGLDLDENCKRYHTWQEAEKGHDGVLNDVMDDWIKTKILGQNSI